ncbi:DMT family transporter [Streptomyces sp. N2-109]|uniref:DMT family transporter n=1 Tax=Streptomyces gossypii TaxID=2883101 RepID=A0ABT2JRF9_9ACTN|nr:DMT family transporter [Streptomyces gossypii]MCT2590074.1 DMT family transporter [Streptomyces gossypii]
MGLLFALASAGFYGAADFFGGLLSRRAFFAAVALLGQVGGLLFSLFAALLLTPGPVNAESLAWGGLSGFGTGLGMVFLYRGMSRGAMSVVVPLSAITGVALPVLAGVALLGDRPTVFSWIGIVVTLPALWLVARRGPQSGPVATDDGADGSADALAAGCGIALQYLALAQAGESAGFWPVAAGRVAAILTILPLAMRFGTHPRMSWAPLRMPPRIAAASAAAGMTATAALLFYTLALHQQLVTVAVVLSSLYPAIPVVLGVLVLRERLNRTQAMGLLAAGSAIVLLAMG